MGEFNKKGQKEDNQTDIDGTQDDIGQAGDQVGGDKITVGDSEDSIIAAGAGAQITVNYPTADEEPGAPGWWKRFRANRVVWYTSLFSGIVISIIVGFFAVTWFVANAPSAMQVARESGLIPSSCAFDPAAEGEALIIVLPFYIPPDTPSSEAHSLIYDEVKEEIEKLEKLGLEYVDVKKDPNVILELDDREAVQELGKSCNAAVVIWGAETRTSVKVNFLNIKEPQIPASDENVQVLAPDTLVGATFVEGHLPGQLSFLALFAVGQAIAAEGEFTEAIPVMEAAVAGISEELGSPDSAAAAYSRLGWLYHIPPTQDYRKARDAYEKSLAFDPTIGSVLGNMGNIYLVKEGQYEKAKEYYEQALAIAQVNDDRAVERAAVGNLGSVYMRLGQYEKAKDYFEQALTIAQETGDRTGEGFWLGKLGDVYQLKGEDGKVKEYYEQALAIAQETGDRTGEGRQLGNLGLVYQRKEEYEKAIDYYERALAIAQETGDDEGEGFWLGNLGLVYQRKGEYEKAIDYYERALAILEGTYLPLAEYFQRLLLVTKREAGGG